LVYTENITRKALFAKRKVKSAKRVVTFLKIIIKLKKLVGKIFAINKESNQGF
jgi:hypothetical protein